MARLIILIGILSLVGCTNNVTKEDLVHLNGYWEIVEVKFEDGQKKTYKVNPSIDYMEINGMKGFKKKVYPKFDGSYDTSDDAEAFIIQKKDAYFVFSYKNALAEWEEQLIQLDEDTFTVMNLEGIRYTYKRYEPIIID